MKVEKVTGHKVTQVINTDGGELLMSFVKACLRGKKSDLYNGNSSDAAQLQAELESIVNKIGEECYNKGYNAGMMDRGL